MTTLTIQLPEHLERKLRARNGANATDLSTTVLQLVEASLADPPSSDVAELSVDEWLKRFRAWTAKQPGYGVNADFDRESIYEGRGE